MARQAVRLNPAVYQEARIYRRALKLAGIPVQRLIIFGSQAKGAAGPDSDIDIAVVSPAFGKNRFREGVRLMRYRAAPFLIEPHPFHPDDLEDHWNALAQEVKRYGIELDK